MRLELGKKYIKTVTMRLEIKFLYIISKVNLERCLMLKLNLDGVIKGAYMSKELLNEKMLLICIMGTLEAIIGGGLSIAEAEKFLFSPHMVQRLKEKKCNESLINIIEKGCELEDIASLLPQDLTKNLEELKQETLEEMKNYEAFEQKFWI